MKKEKVDRVIFLSKKLKELGYRIDAIKSIESAGAYGVSGMFGQVDVPKEYIHPALEKYIADMEEDRRKLAKELEEL